MQGPAAALLAAAIVLLLVVAAAYAWYHLVGWQPFSYQAGSHPAWAPAAGRDISRLRFKDCVFAVRRSDGAAQAHDVTPALNGMAVAYKGGAANPARLALTHPLNPFSFVIPGFNDSATVSDPTARPWCAAPPAACHENGACPPPGVCDLRRGACTSCPGEAAVALTGQWRTL
jgi:hypothetical protein